MATRDRPRHGWTVVLRGPYTLAVGIAAYKQHLYMHHQPQHAAHVRRATYAG